MKWSLNSRSNHVILVRYEVDIDNIRFDLGPDSMA